MLRWVAYRLGRVVGSLTNAKAERSPPQVAATPKAQAQTTRSFHSKLAGVTAKNDDGRSRQDYIRAFCTAGMALRLVREPSNRFDPNAVAVWITARSLVFFSSDVQIGYINADLASELTPQIDRGTPVRASISDVTGGTGGKALGVNILVIRG